MKQDEAIKKVRDLVKENKFLTGSEKFELDLILDKASRNLESYDLGTIIEVLKDLIKDLGDPELFRDQDYLAPRYKDVLFKVLEKVELEKRRTDIHDNDYFPAFDDYRPITLERILSSFCKIEKEGDKIVLIPKDKNLLDRKVNIYHDDGMGYSPGGSIPVFSAYQDKDDNISMWI